MASLQEQFLKAGLVDKKKVKQINQDKSVGRASRPSMKCVLQCLKRSASMQSELAN